jgi:cytochrome c oxidase subunit II
MEHRRYDWFSFHMATWLRPHSPQAQAIVSLFGQYLVLAAIVFGVVAVLVLYAIVRYRARPGAPEPPEHPGSRAAEITWTAIPLLLVLALFVLTVRTMAFVDAPQEPARAPDLIITGQQWWWLARYPGGATTANEIHIPAGRRLLARVDSADVIHDFWAPQLGRKIDAIPGRASYVWLEADSPGVYQGTCSEFCGMQHAGMRFQVIAEPEAEFNAWLQRQAAPPAPPEGLAAEGERLFRARKCSDCHAVSPSDTRTLAGPPLAHVASRTRLGGDRANTPADIALWVNHPQSIKPGNRMPDAHLSTGEVAALTTYLESLR